MGFKRLVSLACDGPCGTVLRETHKAPAGWCKVHITMYEQLAPGQKPTAPAKAIWTCPACSLKLVDLLTGAGFTVNLASRIEADEE